MAKHYTVVTNTRLKPRRSLLGLNLRKMKPGILITLLASTLLAATQGDTSERQLEAAIYKEEVLGDLSGAIKLYKSIAAPAARNRTAAATALLRMGECQEKLGEREAAILAYKRVAIGFSDQASIRAQARGRLQDLAPRNAQHEGPGFGVGTASFPVSVAAGKHLKYSGYIRTEGVTEGWAGLWWRVDGEPGTAALAFDNMHDRGATGTTPWTLYEIELDIPAGARNINFGVLHAGNGTAWFDTLRVELDRVPYADNTTFDLDFESSSPRGFYTGGKGYKVELDKEVAHTGKQSLRSRLVAGKSGQAPVPTR